MLADELWVPLFHEYFPDAINIPGRNSYKALRMSFIVFVNLLIIPSYKIRIHILIRFYFLLFISSIYSLIYFNSFIFL
jgi:hypothetical protein